MSIAKKLIRKDITIKFTLIIEFTKRLFISFFRKKKIYFTYSSYLFHPIFSEIKKYPPINYCNKFNAKIFHYIQGCLPSEIKNFVIIEVIDHPLSLLAPYLNKELNCSDYIQNIDLATEIYLNDSIKKIILVSNGQFNNFKKYFPDYKILEKATVLPLTWKDNINNGKKDINDSHTYLFIASDFYSKGVFLVIDAWNFFKKNNSKDKLILVCHNIPNEIKIYLDNSIDLIETIPLAIKKKNELYSSADIVIALSLTDGISPIEATSYGKPIIVCRGQHSTDFVNNNNGILVDVPVNIYDDAYGFLWKTELEYIDVIKKMYQKNEFASSIRDLVDALIHFSNKDNIIIARNMAIEKYYNTYQIKNRNQKLLDLYNTIHTK